MTSAPPAGTRYTPLDWVLVRAPLLPAGSPAARPAPGTGPLLPDDPQVRAAVTVASPDLTVALSRTSPQDPQAARLRGKLRRYLIRMSTRPTPYGLLAGVGLGRWGEATDLALTDTAPRTRTRPDMGWLTGLIESLEHDPEISARMPLVADPGVVRLGGRVFSMAGNGTSASIRATAAVERTLLLAAAPIARADLVDELAAASGVARERAERLVAQLCHQGYLISEVRPPLTGGEQAEHVRDRLAAIPSASAAADGLTRVIDAASAWDALPIVDRAGSWTRLEELSRTVHPGPGPTVQTDMALSLSGATLHRDIGAEAARAADLLLRLSPFPTGVPHLTAYRRDFLARYGSDRLVPLGELLDPDLGLGPVAGHGHDGPPAGTTTRRHDLLRDMVLAAAREHRGTIELNEATVARLAPHPSAAEELPSTADLPMFLAAASPAALDRGEFRLVVGPNTGGAWAGRTLGRFADLLGAEAAGALAELAGLQSAWAGDRVLAEVVYRPARARSANVAIRPVTRRHEIAVGTVPGVAAENVIGLDELAVGVHHGRLFVRWLRGGADVVAVQGHMLNPGLAPPAVRFLLDVASDGRRTLGSFDWGPCATMPFLPRVQSGRVVLSPARWRIDPTAEDGEPAGTAAWRDRWGVPREVYLAAGDNRLLLDLDDPEDRSVLSGELAARPGRPAVLHEALPGRGDAWLPGPGGGYVTEVVVPLALARSTGPAPRPARSVLVPARERVRCPGSDWLYLKLYGSRAVEDVVIGGSLRSLGEFAVQSGLARGWMFLRYADPEPHLRVRFHGQPDGLLGPLLREVCAWAGGLVADGTCTRFGFDTYEREVERYGGAEGIGPAEDVFCADSAAVAAILSLGVDELLGPDALTVAVLSVDDLLAGMEVPVADRMRLLRAAAPPGRADGAEYRTRQRHLRALLGDPDELGSTPGGQDLAAVFADRRGALSRSGALLRAAAEADALDRSPAEIHRSLVHLHLNRLLGPNHRDENLVLQLLARSRHGLERAPVLDGASTRA